RSRTPVRTRGSRAVSVLICFLPFHVGTECSFRSITGEDDLGQLRSVGLHVDVADGAALLEPRGPGALAGDAQLTGHDLAPLLVEGEERIDGRLRIGQRRGSVLDGR